MRYPNVLSSLLLRAAAPLDCSGDGCGDGSAAKVLIVVRIDTVDVTLAIYYQAPGSSSELVSTAQAVFETMREAA